YDARGNAPAHGGETVSGANTDDRAGDGVRSRDRNSRERCGKQRDSAGGFGAESTNWFQLCDARAHGVNDAPSAEISSESDGSVGREDDGPVVVSPTSFE